MSVCMHSVASVASHHQRPAAVPLHCLHRAVPEPEAIGVLCGTVRIQSAGLLKMKQAQGKSKKKG